MKLTSALTEIGFKNFIPDPCVFYLKDDIDITLIEIYVDDCILVSSSLVKAKIIIEKLLSLFKVKVLAKPRIFLGIELSNIDGCRVLNQTLYIEKLAKRFNLPDSYDI